MSPCKLFCPVRLSPLLSCPLRSAHRQAFNTKPIQRPDCTRPERAVSEKRKAGKTRVQPYRPGAATQKNEKNEAKTQTTPDCRKHSVSPSLAMVAAKQPVGVNNRDNRSAKADAGDSNVRPQVALFRQRAGVGVGHTDSLWHYRKSQRAKSRL